MAAGYAVTVRLILSQLFNTHEKYTIVEKMKRNDNANKKLFFPAEITGARLEQAISLQMSEIQF